MTGVSGAENHLYSLLSGLNKESFDLTLLILVEKKTPESLGWYIQALESVGVKVVTMVIHASFDPLLLNRMASFIKRNGFHIVHTHLIHADLHGTAAAMLAGVRNIISSKHNTNPFRKKPFYAFLDRRAAKYQKRIIAISEAVKLFFHKEERIPLAKFEVIPYGIDLSAYPPRKSNLRKQLGIAEEDLVLGMVARLTRQKGHEFLLGAFKLLLEKHPGLWLVIVGDGELEPHLKVEAIHMGIDERVKFVGHHDDPRPYYQMFDIFVHPSLWEGFGLVFLEAMAYQLPIIATNVDAIKEIIWDNNNGFLVEPGTIRPLLAALEKLVDDPVLRRRMGKSGLYRLKKYYTLDRLCQQTEAVYNSLLLN